MNDEALTTLAQRRHCEPAQLGLHLKSDLDWIVMRCLEKDRKRRYESASALALDLQRYLNEQPIEARPPTRRYRLGKFVRRNKVGVMAGTAIVAALVAGLTLASYGMVQARRQAAIAQVESARSEQVATFLTDMLSAVRPGVAQGRDTTLLREILDKTAERVEADLKDRPDVQGDIWSTLAGTFHALDDREQAAKMYQKAIACYRNSQGKNQSKLAKALGDLGAIQTWNNDPDAGIRNAQLGLDMARELNDPSTLVHCLEMAGRAHEGSEGTTSVAAIPFLEEALQISQRQPDNSTTTASLSMLLALHLDNETEPDRALTLAQGALTELQRQHPPDVEKIAKCNYYLGQIHLFRGESEQALQCLSKAVEIDRTIYPPGHSSVTNPMTKLAKSLTAARRADEGEAIMLELLDRSRTAGPKNETYLRHLSNYVNFLSDAGLFERGIPHAEEAVSLSRELNGPNNRSTIDKEWRLAIILRGARRIPDSLRLHKRIAESCRELFGADNLYTIAVLQDYAYFQRIRHEFPESLAILDELIERVERLATRDGPQPYRTLLTDLRNSRRETVELASNKFLPEFDAVFAHIYNGDYDGANSLLDDFIKALPSDEIFLRDKIAFLLATSNIEQIRNGSRAVELANQAAELSKYTDMSVLDTLAAAYAEAGNFEEAVKWEEKAVDRCPAGSLQRFRDRLQFYRNNKRWWIEQSSWALATSTDPTIRDGKRALEIALRNTERLKDIDSSKLTWSDALELNALAAAYAETGDFDNAVTWLLKAIECARPLQKETFEKRLEFYRNKKRWWVKD